jgi:hypothetical protein
MTFRVGQKVVCVDAGVGAIDASPYLTQGGVYTVSIVRVDSLGVLVLGLSGVAHQWRSSRFRPAVERKTDISIFTAMLKPSKVKA